MKLDSGLALTAQETNPKSEALYTHIHELKRQWATAHLKVTMNQETNRCIFLQLCPLSAGLLLFPVDLKFKLNMILK